MAESIHLSCEVYPKGLTTVRIKGKYHHLSSEESDELIGVVQAKLRFWAAECMRASLSAGIVWKASGSGNRQLSLKVVLIGPFQD